MEFPECFDLIHRQRPFHLRQLWYSCAGLDKPFPERRTLQNLWFRFLYLSSKELPQLGQTFVIVIPLCGAAQEELQNFRLRNLYGTENSQLQVSQTFSRTGCGLLIPNDTPFLNGVPPRTRTENLDLKGVLL